MPSLEQRKRPAACGTGFNVRLWCNTDPCGIVCAIISWFLVLYAECTVVGVVVYPWMGLSPLGLLHIVIFTGLCFLALVSHGKAMMTDPGAVPESALPLALANASKDEIASCPTYGAIRVVCLILEAVLFGLFTMCMMCDQYSVITTGTTQIDRLKGESADNLGLREVSVKNQVLGYVLEHELIFSEDEASEMDTFLDDDSVSDTTITMTTETLEGGWSVEKRVPASEAADVV
ncbi:Lysine-specific demethylase 4A [Phytophthora nicotianae]|uniref:Lysine-specific demethylase 4A n=1 Tax=Phytophthora nicotianae TaxID=4792 RepID=A0A0W8DQN1_PHYNI|nr:Lysine-specific demethylase 4A [Phytophthora nicotianae]